MVDSIAGQKAIGSSGQPYQLRPLMGGHSGAENYEITAGSQHYMLKIFPTNFAKGRVEAIPHICQLYHSLGIDSLKCVKLGHLSSTDQYYCIYNYIDGRNMEEVGESDYDEAGNYRLGCAVGQWLQTLKAASLPPDAKISRADTAELTDKVSALYDEIIAEKPLRQLFYDLLGEDALTELYTEFRAAEKVLAKTLPKLIHGDVKRSNLMQDRSGKLYLIDIESTKYGHDMFNFRHQMTWLLRPDRPKRLQFLRGVLDGLYNGARPTDFNQQILYIYAFNLFEHAYHIRNDRSTLEEYLRMAQQSLLLVLHPQGNIV